VCRNLFVAQPSPQFCDCPPDPAAHPSQSDLSLQQPYKIDALPPRTIPGVEAPLDPSSPRLRSTYHPQACGVGSRIMGTEKQRNIFQISLDCHTLHSKRFSWLIIIDIFHRICNKKKL
jgi:hypothetical protein